MARETPLSEAHLTQGQTQMLVGLYDLSTELGYAPTLRELSLHLGKASPATTHAMLQRLRLLGCVTWSEGKPRTLRLTKQGVAAIVSA